MGVGEGYVKLVVDIVGPKGHSGKPESPSATTSPLYLNTKLIQNFVSIFCM